MAYKTLKNHAVGVVDDFTCFRPPIKSRTCGKSSVFFYFCTETLPYFDAGLSWTAADRWVIVFDRFPNKGLGVKSSITTPPHTPSPSGSRLRNAH